MWYLVATNGRVLRCIRSEVLAAFLLGSEGMLAGRPPVLHLAGARIIGHLVLTGADTAKTLWLEQCYLEEPPDFMGAHVRSIRITESYLPGIDATNLIVEGQFDLAKTTVVGRLRLVKAHVTGEFIMNGSRLINPERWTLFAGGLTVDGGFFARRGFESQGSMRLVGARLNGGAFLDYASITVCGDDALVADNLRVEGRMICEQVVAGGSIRLPGHELMASYHWTVHGYELRE
jgi:hypothetical protein